MAILHTKTPAGPSDSIRSLDTAVSAENVRSLFFSVFSTLSLVIYRIARDVRSSNQCYVSYHMPADHPADLLQ